MNMLSVSSRKMQRVRTAISQSSMFAYTSFSVAETSDAAMKAARPVTAFIVAGSPDAVFEKHGISLDDVEKVRAGFKKGFGDAITSSNKLHLKKCCVLEFEYAQSTASKNRKLY